MHPKFIRLTTKYAEIIGGLGDFIWKEYVCIESPFEYLVSMFVDRTDDLFQLYLGFDNRCGLTESIRKFSFLNTCDITKM